MVEYKAATLDRVFAAVADPTRRAILEALARKPAPVTEVARRFPVSLNAVSKHLMALERAGLISREIRGRQHICRVRTEPLGEALAWMEHTYRFWQARLDALEAHLAARKRTT
ncbi:MAG TPA: metalloregulator ArsR/SmtB family transcription factor [Bryobacteraceae bacterium]|nr:metalloregulator ArsR/SmtB family transcription factor [Bryobacteraceae bacterium]